MHGAQGTSFVVSQLPSLAAVMYTSCSFALFLPHVSGKVSPVGKALEPSGSFLPQAQMFVFSQVGVVAANVGVPGTGTAEGVFFFAKTMKVVLPPNFIVVQML